MGQVALVLKINGFLLEIKAVAHAAVLLGVSDNQGIAIVQY